jgi:thioesterase domain-containing protein
MVNAIDSTNALEQATARDPPTLFLLPGSLGYGPSMASFARAIRKTARIVPLRYPALQEILGGKNTLDSMAAAVIEQIGQVQPSGPLRLLGHSLGGAVAYEAASRFLANGRSVEFLGILDTSIIGEPNDQWETVLRTINRIRTNRVTSSRMACRALAKVAGMARCEAYLARLIDRCAKGRFNATCFRIRLELQEVLRARAFFAWQAQSRPILPLTATLFRCRRKVQMPEALGWDKVFARLEIVPMAGGHIDLIGEPHLTTNRPLIEQAVAQTYSPTELQSIEAKWPARGLPGMAGQSSVES